MNTFTHRQEVEMLVSSDWEIAYEIDAAGEMHIVGKTLVGPPHVELNKQGYEVTLDADGALMDARIALGQYLHDGDLLDECAKDLEARKALEEERVT